MKILTTTGWKDYELLDSGNGFRLERFGQYILQRPDPQIIWKRKLSTTEWDKADAVFQRTTEDKGQWTKKNKNLPEKWLLQYKDLKFWAKFSPFKHTGIFPEQCLQWDFISEQISSRLRSNNNRGVTGEEGLPSARTEIDSESTNGADERSDGARLLDKRGRGNDRQDPDNNIPNILNLFAYTGIASLAAAAAGAKVTHVDASKPTIAWARENQMASGLEDKPIRWILDDVVKFTQREINRGVKYDGIILDPPAFGHSPTGGMWKFNYDFPKLVDLCKQVISSNPLFIIVNAYAISSSNIMLENVLGDYFGHLDGTIESGELCLQEKNGRMLSTGIYARWSK